MEHYSAEQGSVILAPVCYRVLLGFSAPMFPGSTRNKPSTQVCVVSTGVGPYPPVLDVSVSGVQWQRCVVPVLRSDVFVRENLATWSLSESSIIDLLRSALEASFRAAGY